MTNTEPLCWAPWQSIQYRSIPQGITPCCTWFGDRYKGKIDDYLQSEFLTNIKTQLLSGTFPKECHECVAIEKTGAISDRVHQLRMKRKWSPDSDEKIINLDYRPNNLCNLKCRTCKPTDSSSIEIEFKKNPKLAEVFVKTCGNEEDLYSTEVDRIKDELISTDLPHLKRIALLGGEPSMMPEAQVFLQSLISANKHNSIEDLTLYTNASTAKNDWIDTISKFKTNVIFSIDGAGPVYEYARTNATWTNTESNYGNISKIVKTHKIWVVCSVIVIANVEEWIDWFLDKPVVWWPMLRPDNSSLNAMPDDIRMEKISFLKSMMCDKVSPLIKILEHAAFDPDTYTKFKLFHNELDRIRGTSFSTISTTHEKIWNYYEQV